MLSANVAPDLPWVIMSMSLIKFHIFWYLEEKVNSKDPSLDPLFSSVSTSQLPASASPSYKPVERLIHKTVNTKSKTQDKSQLPAFENPSFKGKERSIHKTGNTLNTKSKTQK